MEKRCKDGSVKSERLVHCGEDRSLHERGEPLENTHFRPLHWQSGKEEFHEDNTRFSLLPCKEALIFPNTSSASEEEEGNGEDNGSVKELALPLKKKKDEKKM